MLNQSFEQVFVASSPVLLAQGTTVDLAEGQVGIFDAETYVATTGPTYAKNKALIFAQGRTDLSSFGGLLHTGYDSASDKTKIIKGKKIISWQGKKASRGKKEIVTVGFDGADITKNLTAPEGIGYHFYLRLTGNPITKYFSRDGIIRQYKLDTGCVDCMTGELVNPEKIADWLIDQISKDKEVNKFIRVSKLLYNPTPPVVTTVSYTKWQVSVTDNGDTQAIAAVQVQYPGKSVKLVDRTGSVSTYEIVQLASLAAPAAVSITQPVVIPDCATCPAGYTLVAEQESYLVERSVAAATNLSTSTARQTYADAVADEYQATALRGVTSVTVVGGSGYTNGTYNVVFSGGTGPGGATGTVTVTGGAFGPVTITNPGQYLTAPTAALPAGSGAGTGASLTPVIAPAVNATGKFVSHDGGTAKVLIFVPVGTSTLSAINSDNLTALDDTGVSCTPPAGTTATWTNVDTLLAYPKTIKITVSDDCGDDVLEQIQAQYPDLTITLVGSAPDDSCVHLYETTILSEPVANDCSIDAVKYTLPQPYKGISWVEPKATEGEVPTGLVAGIRIEDIYVERPVTDVNYDFIYHEFDGVHIEASMYNPDYNGDPCDNSEWPVTKIQNSEYPQGTGLAVRKREMRELSLLLRERSINPSVREAEQYKTISKLDKFYDEYTLGFEFEYGVLGWSTKYTDSYRLTVFFEEGQGKAFEDAVNSYIVSTNVGLDPVVL